MKRSILLCQEIHAGAGVGPGVQASVDDVGEVAFEGAAGFAWGLALADLAFEEGFGVGVVALLDDRDAVERGVELAVAAAVQSVAAGGLARPAGDRCGAAEAGEGGGIAEAANVAGVRDQTGGDLVAGAAEVGDRVAVLFEQLGDLGVEIADALVERVDVAGELADAARGDLFGQAVTEADALELAQLALAVAAQRGGLADRVDLQPGRSQALDRLGAIANQAMALQLEQPDRPDQLGFERRAELGAAAQNDLRDRLSIAGIGLARTD